MESASGVKQGEGNTRFRLTSPYARGDFSEIESIWKMPVSFTLLHLENRKTIGVLNYKTFQRVSMMGFFDLRYHGLVVKGNNLTERR